MSEVDAQQADHHDEACGHILEDNNLSVEINRTRAAVRRSPRRRSRIAARGAALAALEAGSGTAKPRWHGGCSMARSFTEAARMTIRSAEEELEDSHQVVAVPVLILDPTNAGGQLAQRSRRRGLCVRRPSHALAQYAATGLPERRRSTPRRRSSWTTVLTLCVDRSTSEFVAKHGGLHPRVRGAMKDLPAFLVGDAVRPGRRRSCERVFARVIDEQRQDGPQLRPDPAVGRRGPEVPGLACRSRLVPQLDGRAVTRTISCFHDSVGNDRRRWPTW